MKLKCLLLVMFIATNSVFSSTIIWGPTGHRVVGEIAQRHLSKKAQRKIQKLLKGQSLAFSSTYGDEIKSDKRYRDFYAWHYVNFPFDSKYDDSKRSPKGDLIYGIEKCKEIIMDEKSSKEDKAFYLKLLVHFIGDLHQPLHVGRAEDKGGNAIKVKWFRRGTNLHVVWDSKMLDHYGMSYMELVDNANKLSRKKIKYIQQGTLLDWVYESQELSKKVYASAKEGENLSYKYMYHNFSTVRDQLQKGGLRLAKVLNEIFG